jgi:hypothetical protein
MTVATTVGGEVTAQKVDAVAWGVFFIWMGIALLAHLGWGVGLLGAGILILGKQMAKMYMALALEMFWVGRSALCYGWSLGVAQCSCELDTHRLHRSGYGAPHLCSI